MRTSTAEWYVGQVGNHFEATEWTLKDDLVCVIGAVDANDAIENMLTSEGEGYDHAEGETFLVVDPEGMRRLYKVCEVDYRVYLRIDEVTAEVPA